MHPALMNESVIINSGCKQSCNKTIEPFLMYEKHAGLMTVNREKILLLR